VRWKGVHPRVALPVAWATICPWHFSSGRGLRLLNGGRLVAQLKRVVSWEVAVLAVPVSELGDGCIGARGHWVPAPRGTEFGHGRVAGCASELATFNTWGCTAVQ
jgi:hypothetical protein